MNRRAVLANQPLAIHLSITLKPHSHLEAFGRTYSKGAHRLLPNPSRSYARRLSHNELDSADANMRMQIYEQTESSRLTYPHALFWSN